MPVRIEEIPNLNGDDGFHVPRMNEAAAEAPAKALGGVGEAISSLGEPFKELGQQVQQNADSKRDQDVLSSWETQGQQHFQDLSRKGDLAAYIPQTQELLAQQKTALDQMSLPPASRQRLGAAFGAYSSRMLAQAGATTAQTSNNQADQVFTRLFDQSIKSGNQPLFLAALDARFPGLAPDRRQRMVADWTRKNQLRSLSERADFDPVQLQKDLDAKNDKGGYSLFSDLTDSDRAALRQKAAAGLAKLKASQAKRLVGSPFDVSADPSDSAAMLPDLSPEDFDIFKKSRAVAPLPNDLSQGFLRTADLFSSYRTPGITDTDFSKGWTGALLGNGSGDGSPQARQIGTLLN